MKKMKMFLKIALPLTVGLLLDCKCLAQNPADSALILLRILTDTTLSKEKRKEIGRQLARIDREFLFNTNKYKYKKLNPVYIRNKLHSVQAQSDSLFRVLSAFARDTMSEPDDRQKALDLLAEMNTFRADSFLVACMADLCCMGEYDIKNEIPYFFPCYDRLMRKGDGYRLLDPILANLNVVQSEKTLKYYKHLITQALQYSGVIDAWLEPFQDMYWATARENHPMEVNMKIIKKMILEDRRKKK
jgi:hypothetical protein